MVTVILPAILHSRKKPVVFFRWAGLGDILCSFPAVFELVKRHPGHVFIYNCHPDFECLPRLGGLPVRTTTTPQIGIVRYWYGWLLKNFYSFDYIDEVPGVVPVEILIQEFARSNGVMVSDAHPRLEVTQAVSAALEEKLSKLGASSRSRPRIVIHPGPTWRIKEWPDSAWSALVQQLRQHDYDAVFQLGVNRHAGFNSVQAPVIPDTMSVVDQLSLEETVALISSADLFIGVDSGLLHVAASVRTPAVGLWGPTSPQMLFSPAVARSFITSQVECQGCQHRYPRLHWVTGCPSNIACMKAITIEEVLNACLNLLKSSYKSLK